jgi:hypothetical protein
MQQDEPGAPALAMTAQPDPLDNAAWLIREFGVTVEQLADWGVLTEHAFLLLDEIADLFIAPEVDRTVDLGEVLGVIRLLRQDPLVDLSQPLAPVELFVALAEHRRIVALQAPPVVVDLDEELRARSHGGGRPVTGSNDPAVAACDMEKRAAKPIAEISADVKARSPRSPAQDDARARGIRVMAETRSAEIATAKAIGLALGIGESTVRRLVQPILATAVDLPKPPSRPVRRRRRRPMMSATHRRKMRRKLEIQRKQHDTKD